MWLNECVLNVCAVRRLAKCPLSSFRLPVQQALFSEWCKWNASYLFGLAGVETYGSHITTNTAETCWIPMANVPWLWFAIDGDNSFTYRSGHRVHLCVPMLIKVCILYSVSRRRCGLHCIRRTLYYTNAIAYDLATEWTTDWEYKSTYSHTSMDAKRTGTHCDVGAVGGVSFIHQRMLFAS